MMTIAEIKRSFKVLEDAKPWADENEQLRVDNAQLLTENARLEAEITQLTAKKAQLEAEIAQIEAECAQLEASLPADGKIGQPAGRVEVVGRKPSPERKSGTGPAQPPSEIDTRRPPS